MNEKRIQSDMQVALGIAQYVAPIKSGNLRFNAIMAERTPDGFRIRYSLSQAFYIYFLEEGTRKSVSNQGFIGNITVPLIASFLSAKYEQKDQSLVNHFRYHARLGSEDIIGETETRKNVQLNSFLQISNGIAQVNGWEHSPYIEEYRENYKDMRMPSYFKPY